MKLITTHKLVVTALLAGIGFGWYCTYKVMDGRIDNIQSAHTEQLRVREVQRAKDEVAAREAERQLAVRAGQIEQEKVNAIATVRSDADALIARLRKQAASKPANPSGVPTACTTGETPTGAVVPDGAGEPMVRLAERADELRAGLAACYRAYDSIGR